MKKQLCALIVVIQFFWSAYAHAESEMEARSAIQKTVAEAFLTRNFDLLESTANEFRSTKARTSSGLWKLTLFYTGISAAIVSSTNINPSRFEFAENITAAWVKRFPDSPTAWISQSLVFSAHGWAHRGSEIAKSVPPASWKPFFKYISMAKNVLETHKTIASSDPKWYEEMMGIARVESWEKARFLALLDEGLKREPVFYQTYFSALEYLLPKWSGSLVEVELFALAAAKRTNEIDGRGMYARIYWYASQTQFGDAIFASSMAHWPSMRAGFEDVIAKYPDSWNLNNYAKFACLAGDVKKTSDLMRRVEKDPVSDAWGSQELFRQCKELALKSNSTT